MHELSVAVGIVRIAEENCKKASAEKVDVIELQIGKLAGIEKSSLEFAWPMAVKNTKLEHAEKEIEWIDGKAKCLECELDFALQSLHDVCPICNSYFKDVTEGKELKVKSLIVS